jgi:hypothetical protein
METTLPIEMMPKESQMEAEAQATKRCTTFLIGWLKRFGTALNLFVFPRTIKST